MKSALYRKETHTIQTRLLAGKREGEAQRHPGAFDPHVVQEVGDARDNVVKEL